MSSSSTTNHLLSRHMSSSSTLAHNGKTKTRLLLQQRLRTVVRLQIQARQRRLHYWFPAAESCQLEDPSGDSSKSVFAGNGLQWTPWRYVTLHTIGLGMSHHQKNIQSETTLVFSRLWQLQCPKKSMYCGVPAKRLVLIDIIGIIVIGKLPPATKRKKNKEQQYFHHQRYSCPADSNTGKHNHKDSVHR